MSYQGGAFPVSSAVTTSAYGGQLKVPVHPQAGSVSAMCIQYELGPGETGREVSLSMSECGLCVVQGRGTIRIGEKEHGFAVGDLAFVPVKARFIVQNASEEPMVMVGIISPPDPDILRAAGLWGR